MLAMHRNPFGFLNIIGTKSLAYSCKHTYHASNWQSHTHTRMLKHTQNRIHMPKHTQSNTRKVTHTHAKTCKITHTQKAKKHTKSQTLHKSTFHIVNPAFFGEKTWNSSFYETVMLHQILVEYWHFAPTKLKNVAGFCRRDVVASSICRGRSRHSEPTWFCCNL